MLNPNRSRNRAALVFLVSLAVFLPALIVPRSAENLSLRTMLVTGSLAATLISGVWLIVVGDIARRLVRLRAGKGVLARWTIDATHWAGFRALSQEWDQRKGVRANDVDLTRDPGEAGMPIVVSLGGVLIGDDFWPLEMGVRITVRADWMEFHDIVAKPNGPALHVVLRIPLQPGKESLAAEVEQAYRRQLATSGIGRRGLLYMGLGILIGLPLISFSAWFIARATGWID